MIIDAIICSLSQDRLSRAAENGLLLKPYNANSDKIEDNALEIEGSQNELEGLHCLL
jgi:hypothetical protein